MKLKRKSKLLNITTLDKEMKNLNFTIVQNDSCFKRVYGRQKFLKNSRLLKRYQPDKFLKILFVEDNNNNEINTYNP